MPFKDIVKPVLSSQTLGRVAKIACIMGLYACLPIAKDYSTFKDWAHTPSDIHAALSLILGCLLVFRTNAAYGRWWEARTLWGSLVNAARNLSIKVVTIGKIRPEDSRFLETMISEFPVALMQHLRHPSSPSSPDGEFRHRPVLIVLNMYEWLNRAKEEGTLDGDDMRAIDLELSRFLDICGACERIARTPFVRSYRIFAQQCIMLFLLTFPWGISGDFHWFTIPLTMILTYFMVGMEIVAEHVEEPFGYDEDDLKLESLCTTIESSTHGVFVSGMQARSAVAARPADYRIKSPVA
jgi:putative membrane protein